MDPRQMQNYGPPMTPPGYPGGHMGSNSFSQSQYPSIAQVGNQNNNMTIGSNDGRIPYTPGRFVGNEDEITAREVPMDGCPAVFPQRDLSCVYLKQWNNRGTIDTVRYILDRKPEATSAANDGSYGEILNRLDRLEELLTAQPKAAPTSRSKSKAKTEEEAE